MTAPNGLATQLADPDSISLPDGTLISAEKFFIERDQRTQIGSPFVRPRFAVGLILGAGLEDSVSAQTAFIWAASMIRRMGRPFAEVRLIATQTAREATYLAGLHRHLGVGTLGEAIDVELLGADPFSAFEWIDVDQPACFEQLNAIVCIGCSRPMNLMDGVLALDISAHGWVVRRRAASSMGTADQAESNPDSPTPFDCAPATAIAAAALAVAEVYNGYRQERQISHGTAQANVGREKARGDEDVVYWSLDSGRVSNTEDGDLWLGVGSSERVFAPWAGEAELAPRVRNAILISTGGIGGNLAQIIAASYVLPGRISLVDPDRVDIPNLNRLIGVLTSDVGSAKVSVYEEPLRAASFDVTSSVAPYEAWSALNRATLDAADTVSIVGADQVATRLEAQADWPRVLLNGSTGGTTWVVSVHVRGDGGCLGCLFANDRRSYAVTRGPQACAAGAAGERSATPELADASYPFVSVSAAATLAAVLIRNSWLRSNAKGVAPEQEAHVMSTNDTEMSRVIRMNARTPAFGQAGELSRSSACLLLCSDEAVVDLLSLENLAGA